MIIFIKGVVFTERRKANVIIGKTGGTASENSENYKISLPSKWIKQLGITKDNKEVDIVFDGESIKIFPKLKYDEFVNINKSKNHKMQVFKLFDRDELLTEICVDYTEEKLCVKNHTDNVLKMAFGVNETPVWKDFTEFLESRCIPSSRSGIREYLEVLGLTEYEPEKIINITQGRMKEDDMYLMTEDV